MTTAVLERPQMTTKIHEYINPDRVPRFVDLGEPYLMDDGSGRWMIEEDLVGRGYQPWVFNTQAEAETFITNSRREKD